MRAVLAPILALLAFTAHAQNTGVNVTLKVGDPAPPLAVGKWVKGEPVKELKKGTPYVIEFWATWCGPCKVAMPHVTKLQKQYADKGLVVIGVNVWERDESKVEPFVKEMGDAKMGYAVAFDSGVEAAGQGMPSGTMAKTWLKAAGRNGIPCSMVVDRDGKIVWIGHPMMMDKAVQMAVDGKVDAPALAAWEADLEKNQKALAEAMKAKNYDDAEKALDAVLRAAPAFEAYLGGNRIQIAIGRGDFAAANKQARAVLDGAESGKDPSTVARTLMTLASAPEKDKLDTKLIVELGERFKSLEKGWQGDWLLARALAADNQWDKAIAAQEKATAAAPAQAKAMMEKTLEEYRAKNKRL